MDGFDIFKHRERCSARVIYLIACITTNVAIHARIEATKDITSATSNHF